MPYGTPGPIVASVPDSDPRMFPVNLSCRAYQLAAEPESALTMASSGSRVDSSENRRIGLIGSASTLRALIPLLERNQDRSWRNDLEKKVSDWWETMDAEAMVEADPINPMRLFSELSTRLPDDAMVSADSGSAANWYARQLRFTGNMRGSLSGTLATMGAGVPYGICLLYTSPSP